MIARLENGKLIPCPKQGRDGRGGLHMNLPLYYTNHPHRAAEDGYYPVRFVRRPADECAMDWSLQHGEIVQIRSACTSLEPADDPILARLDRIEDCLRRISGQVGT